MAEDSFNVDPSDGFIRPKVTVLGVRDLERALSYWANTSEQPTVGEIGSRGGSPVIVVRLTEDGFALNRDTTRLAVRTFLAAAAQAGDARDLLWRVTFNRDGKVNRVTYRSDDDPTPGWYAYLADPAPTPRPLR